LHRHSQSGTVLFCPNARIRSHIAFVSPLKRFDRKSRSGALGALARNS
jgi:hypothetical protein